ncbi:MULTISPECIES: MarR family winged helix-turn-helix transcriptional regulator [Chitinophagaceae]
MSTINESLLTVFSIAKAQSIIVKKFDRLSVHGLGFSDFLILYLLANDEAEQIRRGDLAEKMGLTPSGITRLLAPMEKIGLVSRKSNERDGRVSYVLLTKVGKRIFQEALVTAESVAKDIFPNLRTRNFNALMDVLVDLDANF